MCLTLFLGDFFVCLTKSIFMTNYFFVSSKLSFLILSWNRLFDLFWSLLPKLSLLPSIVECLSEHICFLLSFHSLLGVNLQKVFLACFNCEVTVFVESIFKKTPFVSTFKWTFWKVLVSAFLNLLFILFPFAEWKCFVILSFSFSI